MMKKHPIMVNEEEKEYGKADELTKDAQEVSMSVDKNEPLNGEQT